MPHFQLITVDGEVLGARELCRRSCAGRTSPSIPARSNASVTISLYRSSPNG
jgi:hypothetical protein